ncbi:MAG: ribonuclease P protein component, partial [Patescibacteria group bacterium]
MFSKKSKLPLRQESDFFKKSQKHFSHLFFSYVQKKHKTNQVLVIVPKKNIQKAVWRNQVKRRIYNLLKVEKNFMKGIHLALILRKDIKNISDSRLRKS